MSRRTIGIGLFVLSYTIYGGIFTLPWLDAPTHVAVAAGGGLYAVSYAVMFAAIAVMGREAADAMKARASRWLSRRRPGSDGGLR